MTLIAERDAQSKHYLELRIAHSDLYLDRCYASDFRNETLWKRGKGLVPQWISEKIDREWPHFVDNQSRGDLTVPGLPLGFSLQHVQIDHVHFPSRFNDPVIAIISPSPLENDEQMGYAKIAIHHFLITTFSTRSFTAPAILKEGVETEPAMKVDFTFTVAVPKALDISMVTNSAPSRDHVRAKMRIPVPKNLVHDPNDPKGPIVTLLANFREQMIAANTERLALTDAAGVVRPQFGIDKAKTTSSSIYFTFSPREVLKDEVGAFNFNLWPHYLFYNQLYKTPSGAVRESTGFVEIEYRDTHLCTTCFSICDGKGECPFKYCCKMCWQPIDPSITFREHLFPSRNSSLPPCSALTALVKENPAVMPKKQATLAQPVQPMATASTTSSVLGKTALLAEVPTHDRSEYKRRRAQQRNQPRLKHRSEHPRASQDTQPSQMM